MGTFVPALVRPSRAIASKLAVGIAQGIGQSYAAIIDDAGQLAPYVTFTRSSTATYYGADGLLKTVAAHEPRYDYDPLTLQLRGLLIEEQRTNLFTHSGVFGNAAWVKANCAVTENSAIAPDATLAADKFIPNSGQPAAQLAQTIAVAATTHYSVSVRAKAAENSKFSIVSNLNGVFRACIFDLSAVTASPGTGWAASIKAIGAGWYECVATATSDVAGAKVFQISNNSAGWTGDGTSGIFIWGAQLEAGAFATSYIPTTTAAVTRAADTAVVSDLSSIGYKATEGAFFVEASQIAIAGGKYMSLDDGTGNNRIQIDSGTSGGRLFGLNANTLDLSIAMSGALSANTFYKVAFRYALNDYAISKAGGAVQTDSSAGVPVVNRLQLKDTSAVGYTNGHIRRLRYYPRRLTNAQLQALTA